MEECISEELGGELLGCSEKTCEYGARRRNARLMREKCEYGVNMGGVL